MQILEGHHHFESRASHCTDGPVSPRVLPKLFCDAQDEHSCGAETCGRQAEAEANPYDSTEDDSTTVAVCSQDPSEQPEPGSLVLSPRRQIVGILVSTFNMRKTFTARAPTASTGFTNRDHDPLVRDWSYTVHHVRIRVQ